MSPEHSHTIEFIANEALVNVHDIGETTRLPRIGEEISLPGPDEDIINKTYIVRRIVHVYGKDDTEVDHLSAYFRKVSIYLERVR